MYVQKSPTEKQLLVLTENLESIELFHEFLQLVMQRWLYFLAEGKVASQLVVLTDNLEFVELFHEFLQLVMQRKLPNQRLYFLAEGKAASFSKPCTPIEYKCKVNGFKCNRWALCKVERQRER